MRILHVIHSLDPRSGGPSAMIRELVAAQVDSGHDVALLANTVQSAEPWTPAREYAQQIRADRAFGRCELVLAKSYGRRRPFNRFAYSPEARRWLRRRLGEPDTRPEIVHVHCVFSHITALAMQFARQNRVPYVLSPHGALDSSCYQQGSARLKRLFTRVCLQHDVAHATLLHATSDNEARSLASWAPAEKISVVPLGVSIPEFDREAAAESLRQKFPQLRGRRAILFLSRVAPIKRPELLVQALPLLKHEFPDLVLVVAGQDAGAMHALTSAVEQHGLADRVVFTGFLQGADKRAAFAQATVFALPSSHENFGVAVAEALAHGTPVVVTSEVASHVYVDASRAGRTVAGAPQALADGIRAVLHDDPAATGRRGREYVARHLGWPAIVRRFDEMYAASCDEKPAAAPTAAPVAT